MSVGEHVVPLLVLVVPRLTYNRRGGVSGWCVLVGGCVLVGVCVSGGCVLVGGGVLVGCVLVGGVC